jgi:hypothetical protein
MWPFNTGDCLKDTGLTVSTMNESQFFFNKFKEATLLQFENRNRCKFRRDILLPPQKNKNASTYYTEFN